MQEGLSKHERKLSKHERNTTEKITHFLTSWFFLMVFGFTNIPSTKYKLINKKIKILEWSRLY